MMLITIIIIIIIIVLIILFNNQTYKRAFDQLKLNKANIFEGLCKEGNVSFYLALNTFSLWLYGVRHMVNDHSDSKR